jgi:hypothetical protein
MPQADFPRLGVIFDIDGLADFQYGFAAYRVLFDVVMAVDRRLFENTRLWDGDTNATHAGDRRDYVIAIEAANAAALDRIRTLMSAARHPGLKPASARILGEGALAAEPLVPAARVNALGVMDWCDTSWVRNAWEMATRATQTASGAPSGADESKQSTPH